MANRPCQAKNCEYEGSELNHALVCGLVTDYLLCEFHQNSLANGVETMIVFNPGEKITLEL